MRRIRLFSLTSVAAFTVMSISILLTPFSATFNPTGGKQLVTYAIVLMFWAGLVGGIASTVIANKVRKQLKNRSDVNGNLPGVISFFKTREGIISLAVCAVGIILLIIGNSVGGTGNGIIALQFIGLFFAVWGFSLHCVFDGLNYRLSANKKEVKRNQEETK